MSKKKDLKEEANKDIAPGLEGVGEATKDELDLPEVGDQGEGEEKQEEAKQPNTEQASLQLANLVSQGVKMADAKKRLGIK